MRIASKLAASPVLGCALALAACTSSELANTADGGRVSRGGDTGDRDEDSGRTPRDTDTASDTGVDATPELPDTMPSGDDGDSSTPPPDLSTPDVTPIDAYRPDLTPIDFGTPDLSPVDAAAPDTSPVDASADTGFTDVSPMDGALTDLGDLPELELIPLTFPTSGSPTIAAGALESGDWFFDRPDATCGAHTGDIVLVDAYYLSNPGGAQEVQLGVRALPQGGGRTLPDAILFAYPAAQFPDNPLSCALVGAAGADFVAVNTGTVPAGAAFVVVVAATTFGAHGSYELEASVSGGGTTGPFDAVEIEVPPSGATERHDHALETSDIEWSRPTATCTAPSAGRYVDVFRLHNGTGEIGVVTATIEASFDSFLHAYSVEATDIDDVSMCLFGDDDGAGMPNAELVFRLDAGYDTYIMVSSYGAGTTGSYSLVVNNAYNTAGCRDTCRYADDGECDDGGLFALCTSGTDCSDCGPR